MANYLENEVLCKALVNYKVKRNRKNEMKLVKCFDLLINKLINTYKGTRERGLHDDMRSQAYMNLFKSKDKFKFKPDIVIDNDIRIKRMKYIGNAVNDLGYNENELKVLKTVTSKQIVCKITDVNKITKTITVLVDSTKNDDIDDDIELLIPIKFINFNNAFAWFTSCVKDSFVQVINPEDQQKRIGQMTIVEDDQYKYDLDFSTDYEKKIVRDKIREARKHHLTKKIKKKYHVTEHKLKEPKIVGIFDI